MIKRALRTCLAGLDILPGLLAWLLELLALLIAIIAVLIAARLGLDLQLIKAATLIALSILLVGLALLTNYYTSAGTK